jgi:hypothetical protein
VAVAPDLAPRGGIERGDIIAGRADIHDAADHDRMGLRRSDGAERIAPGRREPRHVAAVDCRERREALVRAIAAEARPVAVPALRVRTESGRNDTGARQRGNRQVVWHVLQPLEVRR